MDVSVVIPTHNRCDALDLTLDRLAAQEFAGSWELIVVDNNSTDATPETIRERERNFPVELISLKETTPGPAAARNAGAARATGEFLIFVDNDILTAPDFIRRHFQRLKANPGCWIVGRFPNLPQQESTVFGRYRKNLETHSETADRMVEVDGITGQGTSMPRADFERLGGFDENFFVASGEDRELAMRAIKSGIRILSDPSIVAYHNDWAGTSIRDYCRRQRLYTRTEPIFAAKYGNQNPRYEMAVRNSPLSPASDGVKLTVSKIGKVFAGSSFGQALLIGTSEMLEDLIPDSRPLWALYRMAIAGAIFKGYGEGLAMIAESAAAQKLNEEAAAR